jgi:choline dehydrogenase
VEEQRLSWDILEKFRAACMSAGIPSTDDFNRGSNEGVGYFKVNQKKGWRWSAATGFLTPIKSRKNLTVMTGAHVHALAMDGKHVTGVTFEAGKTIMTAQAAHEVVLSAGAIGTPHILQLSGIGPGNLLSENGVEVRHQLAGVGGNLQDHLQIRTIFKTQGVTSLNSFANTLIGKARIALEYALFRSGPMSMAPSQLGAFVKSDKAMETPDLQYHVQPLSLGKFGEPLHPFPAFTASVCNLRPESRGVVELSSPDPLAKPRIAPHYLSETSNFEHSDFSHIEAVGNMLNRFHRNPVLMLALSKVKQWHHRACLTAFGVFSQYCCDLFLILCGERKVIRLLMGNDGLNAHLSISPKTMSREPIIATESASICPRER